MKLNIKTLYQDYSSKIGNRKDIYNVVVKKYNIKSCLYPGSHIDISPSFVIPNVTYVDNFKGAIKFFKEKDQIINLIDELKDYKEKTNINFIGIDYYEELDIKKVDLIISQYAGFVGQATKRYLKAGGILLCNDSHGDATLAFNDSDFELVGVLNSKNKIIS